jgi:hypothetical protein
MKQSAVPSFHHEASFDVRGIVHKNQPANHRSFAQKSDSSDTMSRTVISMIGGVYTFCRPPHYIKQPK